MRKQSNRQIRENTRNKVAKEYAGKIEFWRSAVEGTQKENRELEAENRRLRLENQELREKYKELEDLNKLLQEAIDIPREELLSHFRDSHRLSTLLSMYHGIFT